MGRQSLKNLIKQTVRDLRKRQTEAEGLLWGKLRNRKLLGGKFLRQHPIVFDWNNRKRFFVADFYCHKAKLVVEVDGPIHDRQKDYDELREFVLRGLGFKILRFSNKMVTRNTNKVIKKIKQWLTTSLNPSLVREGKG